MTRVEVRGDILEWALDRARLSAADLGRRFPRLSQWISGEILPTLRQLEDFARATHAPIGFFFLPAPPVEAIPIPDFRTVRDAGVRRPSADLLDTIYLCQQRQEWYREYARVEGLPTLDFVASITSGADVPETAATIRRRLGFDLEARRAMGRWEDALRSFVSQADALGILVMASGIVASNTRRSLDPEEFRGFALADPLAPLVFINAADSKSAQMFTLAHELVHIWSGTSGVSDLEPRTPLTDGVERWCNAVAAEILVPLDLLRAEYRPDEDLAGQLQPLARAYKVSTLVILRRLQEAGYMGGGAFWSAYAAEVERLRQLRSPGAGGNFYATETTRVGRRFAQAVVSNTLEGQTLYRDAFRMLSIARMETFQEYGRTLGVTA